jgi:hypothetical protein
VSHAELHPVNLKKTRTARQALSRESQDRLRHRHARQAASTFDRLREASTTTTTMTTSSTRELGDKEKLTKRQSIFLLNFL